MQVYVLGSNTFGQLGLPNIKDEINNPIKLNIDIGDYNCIDIDAGHATSYVITECKKLYTWGCCTNGRIGFKIEYEDDIKIIPTKCNIGEYIPEKIQAGSVHSCILTNDGKILSTGHKYYSGHNNNKDQHTYKIIDSIKEAVVVP